MSQKTQADSMPDAEAVDLPEISVEHSTEFLTGSAPCAGVSRPLPAAWLGQRGIYRSRFEAVCNGEQLVDPLTLGELIQRASPSTELAERGTQHRFSTTKQTCRHDFYGVWWNDSGVTKTGRECRHCGFFVADAPEVQAEAERPELWAVHAQGPDELYAAFTREDAEKHAAELNALPMPEGIAVGAVVVPSPWPAVQHWQYLAEQEQDHKNEITGRLRQLERICEGLPQDAIDGGWTVQGIRGYAKRLEDQLKAALARVAELDQALAEKDPFGAKLNRISEKLERCDALLAARAAQAGQVPQAWLDVQAERRRQVEAEGWTPEHDDEHDSGEIACAAACYALPPAHPARIEGALGRYGRDPNIWPWTRDWWKPAPNDRRRELIKAGALVLAEIERLDRAAATQGGPRDA
ncbi:hypothetical protein ABZR07_29590 [Pseudomonas aeruginosa]|uniref:hypothetical protein n=1 Tax=Pseudomonas aeruginosa TaxID=287 RepID=UPI00053D681A|nr:hypothetical protein [Pseudomonas aeruginosa]EKJ7124053.1 hypothetical protein [Pseudomonas aeruginosa]KSJ34801.1 hypothetical protein AO995_09950 [Pseudomonas aeruginosa]KSL98602.1 hypothetical protein APA59_10055 [Pseudomonas aeruginosa]MBG6488124.1 hypothetical protein [Pseudomonas aeruginosa]MBV5979959.1 hypothetical protein [Pseudomonas aeruginosa]